MSPSRAGRLWANNRGATMLEFGLIAPAFFTLLLGLIYLSMTLWTYASMQYAVEEAARCYRVKTLVCTSAATTQTYATSHYYGPYTPAFVASSPACGQQVTASLNYSWSIPLFSFSKTLSASACFP
jgi:Flp pilus assembly protein TadG